MLVPKPGKNPEDCASYRPISPITADGKIFAKILGLCLSRVMEDLIHVDQTGFMPGRGTDNIHSFFLNLATFNSNRSTGVIYSLDAEKAFDSVEWEYLWEVLRRFGFGYRFLQWLGMPYSSP